MHTEFRLMLSAKMAALKVFAIVAYLFVMCVLPRAVFALPAQDRNGGQALPADLTEVGLEKLLSFELEVTSVSKKKQKLSDVASAVFILTQEDIRRSGVTHVAEALRLVPGLSVARVDSDQWAISARGFNQVFANKLLVLIDGRSVFTPLFNGVFWELNELVLEDIDQIEVIRGPGAALWGSNAVNGVINIITKHADDSQGLLVSGGGGSEEIGFGTVRYGGKIGDRSSYRVFSKYSYRDTNEFRGGGDAKDYWEVIRNGFRLDSELTDNDSLMLQGDVAYQEANFATTAPSLMPPFTDSSTFVGTKYHTNAAIVGRWNHKFSEVSDLQLQFDYYFENRESPILRFDRHTLHFDFHHRFNPIENHDVMYGVEYRLYADDTTGTFADDFEPENRSTSLYTWFVNDEITLIEDKLHLILGSKFEHNAHTGFEFMPNGRLLWKANDKNSFWAAVSRAVALPSRVLDDVILPVAAFPDPTSGLTGLVTLFGDRGVEATDLLAYEAGFRSQLSEKLSFDVAFFFNEYDDIETVEPGMPFVGSLLDQAMPALIIPVRFDNDQQAKTYGVEVAVDWRPTDWWRLIGWYSYLNINVDQGTSMDDNNVALVEGGSPDNQFHIRSLLDLPHDLELDSMLRYVDRLNFRDVDSYFELDVRLGWRATENLEFSVVGQNLLESSHQESGDVFLSPRPTEIERGVYGKVTATF